MARKPQKPQKGQPAIKELYNSVCDIIDYLPSLEVVGDQKSTYVTKSSAGTVIHAKQPNTTTKSSTDYIAGSGIVFTSGNVINAKLSAGPNINIDYNSGWLVISGTPAGSGSSSGEPPSNGRFNTIGAGNSVNSTLSGCGIVAANLGLNMVDPPPNYYITINETPSAGYNLISSDLTRLTQLYNYDLVSNSQADIGSANMDHYVRAGDLFINSTTGNRGLGTQINFYKHSIGNTYIDPQTGEQHLVNPIMGLKVDLTITGGTWMGVSAVPRQVAGFDVDPEELEINCLLTGTYDHYPHTSGFIDIVPTIMEDGKTWGVISTNLHAGSGIAIDPQTGEITCTIEGGGGETTIIASGLQYPNYSALFNDDNGNVSGNGISFILPVSAGQEYKYYTDARDEDEEHEGTYIEHAFATYAPAEGETGDSRRAIANGVEFVPSANGYIRISVFDDGKHQGKCLRFYKGGDTSYEFATPLYRFHGFTNYEAGSGIAIESGIISCMLQTDTNVLSGITSAALTTGNPYNPIITGIAIGLSTAWAEDLANINKHTLAANTNKVLSSNNYGNLVWADNVQIPPPVEAGFKVPDFAKLQVTNDAGEEALGLGNTFIIPVSGGSTVRYSADGGTIIARWAPVKGSSKTAFEVTTTNKTTTDDGYVRISVIDPGTLDYGCLRLYVDNKDIPLHKFAKFNYSSGAIYEAGRYTDIQTTSTRINAETELEEEYLLENPIINNMLTGGNHITIQQTEMVGGVEQQLQYPRINCDLSEGTNIQITTGGVINCTLSGDNSTVFINDGVISARATSPNWTSLTPSLLAVNNNNHTLSAATQSGGGGGGGGMPWPNYANLDNNGGNMIMMYTRYQAGSAGGWLRISYKGNPVDDCYYVKIGPDGNNDPQIGLWRVDRYAYGNGEIGNTWLLPIPPDNYFYVSFPQSVASAWFDSAVSDDSPSVIPPSAINYGNDIINNYNYVYDLRNGAEEAYNATVNSEDWYEANDNAEWAEGNATDAENYATDSETKNAVLTGLGINSYTTKTQDTRALATEARNYATSARTAANAFPH